MDNLQKLFKNQLVEIERKDECTIYSIVNDTGEAVITHYKVFPGVEVCYNDMHIGFCEQNKCFYKNIMEINHCREGRFECELYDGTYTYLEPGDFAVNCLDNKPMKSCFPISHYHGISILININKASGVMPKLLEDISIDLTKIKEALCPNNRLFVMRSTSSIQHIFSELYTVPDKIKMGYLKLKVLELLLFLSAVNPSERHKERQYLIKSHVNSVKEIHDYMTANLDKRFTLEELSSMFAIPLTAMKQCFKGVYGNPIYSYMKIYRMQEAAKLLKESDESITEIALKLGYKNAGKFSTAFKSTMNILPSDYRKKLCKCIKIYKNCQR
jgi:AraC-like DNA-binding protein